MLVTARRIQTIKEDTKTAAFYATDTRDTAFMQSSGAMQSQMDRHAPGWPRAQTE